MASQINRRLSQDLIAAMLILSVTLFQMSASQQLDNCDFPGSQLPSPPPPAFPDFVSAFEESYKKYKEFLLPEPGCECAYRVGLSLNWTLFNDARCSFTSQVIDCNPPTSPLQTTPTAAAILPTLASISSRSSRSSPGQPVLTQAGSNEPSFTFTAPNEHPSVLSDSSFSVDTISWSSPGPFIIDNVVSGGLSESSKTAIIAAVVCGVVAIVIIAVIVAAVVRRKNDRCSPSCFWFHRLKKLSRQTSEMRPIAIPTPSSSQPVTPCDNPSSIKWSHNGKAKFDLIRGEESLRSAIFPEDMNVKHRPSFSDDIFSQTCSPPKAKRQESHVSFTFSVGESSSDTTWRGKKNPKFSKSVKEENDDEDEVKTVSDIEEVVDVVVLADGNSMLGESSTDMTLKRNLATYANASGKALGAKQAEILSMGGDAGPTEDGTKLDRQQKSAMSRDGEGNKSPKQFPLVHQTISDKNPTSSAATPKSPGVVNAAFINDEGDSVGSQAARPQESNDAIPLNITEQWDNWVANAFDKVLPSTEGDNRERNTTLRKNSSVGSETSNGNPRHKPGKPRLQHADSDVNNENVIVDDDDEDIKKESIGFSKARKLFENSASTSRSQGNGRFTRNENRSSIPHVNAKTASSDSKTTGTSSAPTTPVERSFSSFHPKSGATPMSPKIQNTLTKKPATESKKPPPPTLQKSSPSPLQKSPSAAVTSPLKNLKSPTGGVTVQGYQKNPSVKFSFGEADVAATAKTVSEARKGFEPLTNQNGEDAKDAGLDVTSLRAQFEPQVKPVASKNSVVKNNLNKI